MGAFLYLGVNGGCEVAEQPDIIFLTGLHVHHQAGVEVSKSRCLGKRLVQHHLPIGGFTVETQNLDSDESPVWFIIDQSRLPGF